MSFFDDFLPSYRGVGVIGTCLAAFVLFSLICLSFFALDPSVNGMWESNAGVMARQDREIGRLTREVEETQDKLEIYRETKKFHEEVKANLARQAAVGERQEEIEAKIAEAEVALAELRSRHETYAAAYREQVRAKAVGEVFPSMDTRDGRHLEAPVVVKVNPAGIQFRYEHGIVRVAVKDLPLAIQERFQFDAAEMERYLADEEEKSGRFEEEVDRGLAEKKESSRKEAIERQEEQVLFLKQRVADCAREYALLRKNPRRNYETLKKLIRQVDVDEAALRKCETELARMRAAEREN